jgi:nitrate/nitrite transporter NarK
MIVISRSSDRTLKRREHLAFALVLAGVGVAAAGLFSAPVLIMAMLSLSMIGVSADPPCFWPLPSSFLSGASAAAGIAAINSLGNLAGFFGPYMMGYFKDLTGNFTVGLLVLGGVAFVGAVTAMSLRIDASVEMGASDEEPVFSH